MEDDHFSSVIFITTYKDDINFQIHFHGSIPCRNDEGVRNLVNVHHRAGYPKNPE
jgi:hypothetical protein